MDVISRVSLGYPFVSIQLVTYLFFFYSLVIYIFFLKRYTVFHKSIATKP